MTPKRSKFDEVERSFANGEIIFREGEQTREMFVIQSGEVSIVAKINGEEKVIETRQRGEFFGEMALLESLPRSATAMAKGDTRLLVIYCGGFLQKLRRDPTFAFEMLQKLSSRFRKVHHQMMMMIEERNKADIDKDEALILIDYREANKT
jgi:CRP/FNR family cyclic AMP-dependent transcriptional regulator